MPVVVAAQDPAGGLGGSLTSSKMLKALDIIGLLWLTLSVLWRMQPVPVDCQTREVVLMFNKGGQWVCFSHMGVILVSQGKLMPGCWKGGFD